MDYYTSFIKRYKYLEVYKDCVYVLTTISAVFTVNAVNDRMILSIIKDLENRLYPYNYNEHPKIIIRYNEKTIYESSNDPKSVRCGLKTFYLELEKAFKEDWLGSGYGRKFAAISFNDFNDNEAVVNPIPQLTKIKQETNTDSIIFSIETSKDGDNK